MFGSTLFLVSQSNLVMSRRARLNSRGCLSANQQRPQVVSMVRG